MSVYNGKLLELVAIEKKSDKFFLHIRLSLKEEILLEIDRYTGENLKSVTEFDRKFKYRLSFHSSWDTLKNQHKGILTRTHKVKSEPIYFSCSEDYINKLKILKTCDNIDDLNLQISSPITLAPVVKQEGEEKEEQRKIVLPRNSKLNLTWTTVTVMIVILTILISYSSHIYLNKTPLDNKVMAQTMTFNNEKVVKEEIEFTTEGVSSKSTLKNNKIDGNHDGVIYLSDDNLNKIPSGKSSIPSVKLNDTITYDLKPGTVALTFDDGPSKYSIKIMDILNKYKVGGTFFFIGLNVNNYPNHVKQLHLNGYSIGTHSMNHVNVSTLSYEKQEKELIQSSKLLKDITKEEVTLFRPPYGAYNRRTKDLVEGNEYKMVLWNIDPKDWETRHSKKILNHIKDSHVSGSIILLHESQAVVDALPGIIEYLQELNLEIVSIK